MIHPLEIKHMNIVNNMKNRDDADWLRCIFQKMKDFEEEVTDLREQVYNLECDAAGEDI
jgi:hypothetical protein